MHSCVQVSVDLSLITALLDIINGVELMFSISTNESVKGAIPYSHMYA